MAFLFANNAVSTLASGIGTGDTSITLQSGDGAKFPSPSGGDSFRVTLADASNNIEIVDCTARAGDVLTVTRAQEGTTAKAYLAGDAVGMRLTSGVLDELAQNAEAVLKAVAAIKTAGNLTFNDSVQVNFGTDTDVEMYFDGSQMNIDVNGDQIVAFRDGNSGNANVMSLNIGTGEMILSGVLDVSGLFKMQGGYSEDADTLGNGPGTIVIDVDVASHFISGASMVSPITFQFNSTVPAGRVASFTLRTNNLAGIASLAWPASVTWPDGVEPVWSAGVDIITFFTDDGGTTWYGFAGGINMS